MRWEPYISNAFAQISSEGGWPRFEDGHNSPLYFAYFSIEWWNVYFEN